MVGPVLHGLGAKVFRRKCCLKVENSNVILREPVKKVGTFAKQSLQMDAKCSIESGVNEERSDVRDVEWQQTDLSQASSKYRGLE